MSLRCFEISITLPNSNFNKRVQVLARSLEAAEKELRRKYPESFQFENIVERLVPKAQRGMPP